MRKAEDAMYEMVTADDIPAALTPARIDRDSVPEGLYCYDVRHDDYCQGIATEIKPHVMVNHLGTILTKQEVPLPDGKYCLYDDLKYAGLPLTLGQFERMGESELAEYIPEDAQHMRMYQ